MYAEYVAIDDRSERKEVKSLVEVFPAVRISILFVDFIQKSIHHGHISTLVVASQQEYPVWVLNFQTEQKGNGFNRMIPSINKISNHNKLVSRTPSTLLQQIFNIKELSMDISSHINRTIHTHDIRFLGQYRLHCVTKRTNTRFCYRLAV